MTKKVLIIGASSGIGKELSLQYAQKGWQVVATARNTEKLKQLEQPLISVAYLDITDTSNATTTIRQLIQNSQLTIISAGVGKINKELALEPELQTIQTNVLGFTTAINAAFNYYKSHSGGHIAVLSSLASLRGSDVAPAYNASKAFVTNYMDGLRKKAYKENLNIRLTTILPGLVDTQMAKGEGLFWVEPVEKAARQIIQAIAKNKKEAVITHKWKLIYWLLKILPSKLYYKL